MKLQRQLGGNGEKADAVLCFLPHGNGTWEAKQNQNTIGAAVSSVADTQTEHGRFLLTSAKGACSGPITGRTCCTDGPRVNLD